MRRRRLMQAGLGLALSPPSASLAAGAKVLRWALPSSETTLDPASIGDGYSLMLAEAVFEAPLVWDYLARPYRLKPLTAQALPEVSSDARRFVLRIRPGTGFATDAAFKGASRELVAEDYVYSLKRHFDPRFNSAALRVLEAARIVGMDALRRSALAGEPFDYDTPVAGLRTLDRYTLQVLLEEPAPRFPDEALTESGSFGAVAREVVEHYGSTIGEHPVGTGPFRLAAWRRSSRLVFERNPGFREERYDEQPAADDAPGQAIAARLAGRRLPLIDRIEVAVIDEDQPRWLAFERAEIDILEVPYEFAPLAVPNGELAPYLDRRGVRMDRMHAPSI